VLAIALANKLAHIAWAVLNKERNLECVKTSEMASRSVKRGTVLGVVKAWPGNPAPEAGQARRPALHRQGARNDVVPQPFPAESARG
jgi:hypothetical protein